MRGLGPSGSMLASMRDFVEWIDSLHLIDIPLHGIKFTWARRNSQSKLDRCLCSNEWITSFPEMRLEGYKKGSSDHFPLILNIEDKLIWGPKPFRCYDSWFLHPDFKCFVSKEWKAPPNLNVFSKMKALKGSLKRWSIEKFGCMDNTILKLENAIHELQKLGETRQLNDVECARLRASQNHLQALHTQVKI